MNDDIITDFELFWRVFPRREAKKDARKAWNQLSPDAETQQKIHDALAWQIPMNGWDDQHANRRFTPLPATWLRGERWNDQKPANVKQVQRESARSAGVEYTRWLQARRDGEVRHTSPQEVA